MVHGRPPLSCYIGTLFQEGMKKPCMTLASLPVARSGSSSSSRSTSFTNPRAQACQCDLT